MAELDRELNNQVARGRLKSLLDSGAQISIHGTASVDDGGVSPWIRRAMGAAALTVAGAAAGAQMPTDAIRQMAEAKNLQPVQVIVSGKVFEAPHPMERVRLCKEIASEQRLNSHGFDWRDLYAVVQAETAWAALNGMGLNGKASFGLAQMEDATAKALGIDPHDSRQALQGVARLLKEAAAWTRARGIEDKKAAVSVYYNLSTKARNEWDGVSVENLPTPTKNHIRNLRDGHKIATSLGPKYEKFMLKARQVLASQAAVKNDLVQQRAHIASLPAMGFEAGDVAGTKTRISDILASRHSDVGEAHVGEVAALSGMSVQMRMKGFPGSALRPSEEFARRSRNQVQESLRHQGLDRLTESLQFIGRAASDVVASARAALLSAAAATAGNSLSSEFPTLGRAVAAGGSDLTAIVQLRTAGDLAEAQPPAQVKSRAMVADARLSVNPEARVVKDVQIAAMAPDALRKQQAVMAQALQRLASQVTSSAAQYALNEQGRMVASAAGRAQRERQAFV